MERVVAVERAADTLAVDGERATAREDGAPEGADGAGNVARAMSSTIHAAIAPDKGVDGYAHVVISRSSLRTCMNSNNSCKSLTRLAVWRVAGRRLAPTSHVIHLANAFSRPFSAGAGMRN